MFIKSLDYQTIITAINIFFSVVLMKEKLDSEGLGIILVTSFIEEFFPKEKQDEKPKTFVLCHYNGIKRSNEANKVR